MAYTITRTKTVFGNLGVSILNVTADAATQTIETGHGSVLGFSYGPVSMNSSNIHFGINSNASGVQSFGVLSVTGCTSGDDFVVTIYGAGH